jgi:hypothetical protein
MSMPDKWEYPWYASWDLAFHCIPFALIDSGFAKSQLDLLMREWYMHPNGQLPAYEWAFGDVNPPVLAWATWRVYKIDQEQTGCADRVFLERIFHKLLLNFTWWVNRKDSEGKNVFQGGFLGLDNIGVFDRSAPLPTGGSIEQSDGTSWMGMFCLNMMTIALELALNNPVYQDIALKFFEHFLAIAAAMNNIADEGIRYLLIESLQKFYYFYGDDFKVECPTGSGRYLNLKEVANELSQRLIHLFLRDNSGRRPFNGGNEALQHDPHWRDYLLFHEFFHGDNGAGLGASHQTGWTGLVAMLLQQQDVDSAQDPRGISSVGHRQTVPLSIELPERS